MRSSWCLVLVLSGSGCAAGRASVALIQAQAALDDAADRGANEHATYEMSMGRAYLVKAREEASFSSYRTSVELSRTATGWADNALIAMQTEGKTGAGASAPPTTTSAPPTTTSAPPTTTSPSSLGPGPSARPPLPAGPLGPSPETPRPEPKP